MGPYIRIALFALAILAIVGLWTLLAWFIQARSKAWDLSTPCLECSEVDDPYTYALCAHLSAYTLHDLY